MTGSGSVIDERLLRLTSDAATWRAPLSETCSAYDIDSPARQSHFIAQCAHESAGFRLLVESLRYSAAALLQTWPRRFTPEQAIDFAFDQQRIAERVYGGRLGNGIEGTGDGYRYRGRGLIQVTGRGNYRQAGRALSLDLETSPELLEVPQFAALSAGWFWQAHGCNELADEDDLDSITRKINGGTNGMADRASWLAQAERALA